MYRIGEFSKITGASIRTLRYYDQIDLLKPYKIDLKTGYRFYNLEQIVDYIIILELKNVGFSLNEIKLYWNNFDVEKLDKKKNELLNIISSINNKINKIEYLKNNVCNGKFIIDIGNINLIIKNKDNVYN